MKGSRTQRRALVACAAAACLFAASTHAETPKQQFEVTIEGNWPVRQASGRSAWLYDMGAFMHIGLDTMDEKNSSKRVLVDLSRMSHERPKVGKYPIGGSDFSHYAASIELVGDSAHRVRAGTGELEITKVTPVYTSGTFYFKSNPAHGGPEITVRGRFVAKERPKRKSK